jgi:hypothetical protein
MPMFKRRARPTRKPRKFVKRKRFIKRAKFAGPVGRFPKVYPFTREEFFTVNLANVAKDGEGIITNNGGLPSWWYVGLNTTDNLINFQPSIYLQQIPNYTEFQGLFGQYRILGMQITFYPAYTSSTNFSSQGTSNSQSAPSVLCWAKQNFSGVTETDLSLNAWAQITRKRTSIFCPGRKPHQLYAKCKTMTPSVIHDGTITTASTSITSPKWQATNDSITEYRNMTYGLHTLDNSLFSTWGDERMKFTIRVKYYLQMRYPK